MAGRKIEQKQARQERRGKASGDGRESGPILFLYVSVFRVWKFSLLPTPVTGACYCVGVFASRVS